MSSAPDNPFFVQFRAVLAGCLTDTPETLNDPARARMIKRMIDMIDSALAARRAKAAGLN